MQQSKTLAFRMLAEKKSSVLNFWMSFGDTWPTLQALAKRVLSMVASSAASERNFSTFGFIRSKLRNRLSETSVEKLVYIKTNNYHLNTIQTKQRWLEATNSPDEDMSIEESDDNQERAHTDQGNEVNEGEQSS